VTTLYDDLGVSPGASAEDLRRAYRALARRLHPDVNGEAGSEERMRRVNHAWTVLGDPGARERYDLTLLRPAPGAPGNLRAPETDPVARPAGWLRPSVLVIAVLTIIFIATAYLGPHPGGGAPRTVPSTAASAGSQTPSDQQSGLVNSPLVGQCILAQAGYDALVPCSQRNDGLVVGQTTRSADCPTGTAVHQLAGRPQFVCLAGGVR